MNLGNAKAACMHTSRIVDEDSATLGRGHEELIPVAANHINICKFESLDDPTFDTAQMRINQILGAHVSVVVPNTSSHQPDAALPRIGDSWELKLSMQRNNRQNNGRNNWRNSWLFEPQVW